MDKMLTQRKMFEKLIAESPDLDHVIVSGDNPHGYRLFEDIIGADEPEDVTAPTLADDMAFWLYTSGSTGKPKGAVHVHASLKLTADLYGTPIAGLKESDVVHSVAKLFFAYGLGNALTFPASVQLVFETPPEQLWQKILNDKGGWKNKLLAQMPDDLSLN